MNFEYFKGIIHTILCKVDYLYSKITPLKVLWNDVEIEDDTKSINFIGADVEVESISSGNVEVNVETLISDLEYNTTVRLSDGLYSTPFYQDGLISGGIVTWDSGFTFNVSAATYRIGGVLYKTPTQQVTLSDADLTDNRFDVIAVDTNENILVIEGTPSPTPLDPSINPETQIKLTSILIIAASTEYTTNVEWIYRENVEWTSSTDAITGITFNDVDSPFNGSISVEATLTPSASYFQFTRGSVIDTVDYKALTFKIHPTVNWTNKNWIEIQFFNGINPIGKKIIFKTGTYGFDVKTFAYQHIAIPLSDFSIAGSTLIDRVRFKRNAAGVLPLGKFYVDDIQLIDTEIVDPFVNLPLAVQDEGVTIDPNVNQINFIGSGVTATQDTSGKINVNIPAGGGSVTANNGVNMSTATNVQLGGPLILDTTIIGGYTDANAQTNTAYDTEIGKYFYNPVSNLAKYNNNIVSIQGATTAEGTKSVYSQEVLNYATQTNSKEQSYLFVDYGANKLVGELLTQLFKSKTNSDYSISKKDYLEYANGTEFFEESIRLDQVRTDYIKDIYFEDSNGDFAESYDYFKVEKIAGVITGNIGKENAIYINNQFYGTDFWGNLTSGSYKIYSQAGNSNLAELITTADLTTAGYIFRHMIGGDTLNIVNPTTLATGNTTQFLPISVNGNYADDTGNITISGGGNPSWELLGNTGTDETVNFLGTTDNEPISIRTNSVKRFSISNTHANLRTHDPSVGSGGGGGFYVNSGNETAPLTYPGANIGISGGHNGGRTLSDLVGGYWNIAIGDGSLDNIINGHDNIAIGRNSLNLNTENLNTAVGQLSLENNITGYANVSIGGESGRYFLGRDSVGVGYYANRGTGGCTGFGITAIGSGAGESVGSYNIAVGFRSMSYGWGNLILRNIQIGAIPDGWQGGVRDSATDNVAIGHWVGYEGITGNENVIIGLEGGASGNNGLRVGGNRNVLLGSRTSGYTGSTTGNITIGSYIVHTGGDAKLNIGNVIYGTNMYNTAVGSSTPVTNGRIGIKVAAPSTTLHIYSEAANTSGLRLERLTSASPTSAGQAIGVDSNGNVVTIVSGGPSTISILNYVEKTAIYTFNPASDYTVNCTANTFNLTLPTAVGITGQIFVAKNVGAGVITLNTTSSQTIDGALTVTINQYESVKVQSTGANWIII